MISRSESKRVIRGKRNARIRSVILKLVNLLSKTYMYLGFALVLLLSIVSLTYKSYLHRDPPFYERIPTDYNLVIIVTAVISSFFLSGIIALMTEQKKIPKQKEKQLDKPVEKPVRKRRRRNKVA